MRLKEIKPGMVIHCRTDKEIKAISDAGFTGYLSQDITRYMIPECYVIIRENNTADWTNDFETAADFGKIIEFSDLILPELTAEEAVEWLGKHYNDCSFEEAFGYEYTMSNMLSEMTPGEVVEKIAQWKSDHEKKEPEIEWVYRVFGAENFGEKLFRTEEEAIKRCEELVKSQKNRQFARYERVCRVKE